MILSAVLLISYNLYLTYSAESDSETMLDQLETIREDSIIDEQPDYLLDPNRPMPVMEVDGIGCVGIISFPALELELPVAAVWDYPTLRKVPCLYRGSAYTDDMVICAHNYTVHFGRIGSLSQGDEVIFTDMDGNEFRYEVASVEILRPTAVEDMIESEYELSLFTCTPGGRTRLTVRCGRIS